MLAVLVENHHRVVGRRELARRAGLTDLNERRCDSVLVGIRKLLGPDSIVAFGNAGCGMFVRWSCSCGAHGSAPFEDVTRHRPPAPRSPFDPAA